MDVRGAAKAGVVKRSLGLALDRKYLTSSEFQAFIGTEIAIGFRVADCRTLKGPSAIKASPGEPFSKKREGFIDGGGAAKLIILPSSASSVRERFSLRSSESVQHALK